MGMEDEMTDVNTKKVAQLTRYAGHKWVYAIDHTRRHIYAGGCNKYASKLHAIKDYPEASEYQTVWVTDDGRTYT
jgi:hypothetical protein